MVYYAAYRFKFGINDLADTADKKSLHFKLHSTPVFYTISHIMHHFYTYFRKDLVSFIHKIFVNTYLLLKHLVTELEVKWYLLLFLLNTGLGFYFHLILLIPFI